jgi:leucyl aminopeptidase
MVTITSPTNGSTVSGNVTVAASATDNLGVSKVEFRVDGVLVATDTSAPYSFGWNTRKLSGSHTITATAYDTAGNQASASSTVTVTPSSGGGPKKR